MKSKYFTPELTALDRRHIVDAMGLGSIHYYLIEQSENSLLNTKEMVGITGKPFLDLGKGCDVMSGKSDHELPRIILSYSKYIESKLVFGQERPLWERVLPYPLNEILRSLTKKNNPTVNFEPIDFRRCFVQLFDFLSNIERALERAELSLLWIKGTISYGVLFHFVRKKCVRVGTNPEVLKLGETLASNEISEEELRRYFRTTVQFISVIPPIIEGPLGGSCIFDQGLVVVP